MMINTQNATLKLLLLPRIGNNYIVRERAASVRFRTLFKTKYLHKPLIIKHFNIGISVESCFYRGRGAFINDVNSGMSLNLTLEITNYV